MMKTIKKSIMMFFVSFSIFGQVGINTVNPKGAITIDAGVDNNIVSDPSISQALNDLIILLNGNMGIGLLPIISSSKLEVMSNNTTSSVLKLNNISDTEVNQIPEVNYQKLSELVIDDQGNVCKVASMINFNSTAESYAFDGEIANVGTTPVVFTTSSAESVIRFEFYTNFKYGSNSSYLISGEVVWSLKAGFKVVNNSFTATSTSAPDSITVVGNNTNSLTFDFVNHADLVFTISGTGDNRNLRVNMSSIPYGTSSLYFFNTRKFK